MRDPSRKLPVMTSPSSQTTRHAAPITFKDPRQLWRIWRHSKTSKTTQNDRIVLCVHLLICCAHLFLHIVPVSNFNLLRKHKWEIGFVHKDGCKLCGIWSRRRGYGCCFVSTTLTLSESQLNHGAPLSKAKSKASSRIQIAVMSGTEFVTWGFSSWARRSDSHEN
jgi:hypothetical protein